MAWYRVPDVFETVTFDAELVVTLPSMSYAFAVMAHDPSYPLTCVSVNVFHETEYGDVVSVANRVPLARNSTFVTPTSSLAVDDAVTVGSVPPVDTDTVGEVDRTLTVVTAGALVALPASSVATAFRGWDDPTAPVTVQLIDHGAALSKPSEADPSKNSTCLTSPSSFAEAETATVPETSWPGARLVIEVTGAAAADPSA